MKIEGSSFEKDLPDGRVISAHPTLHEVVRLGISQPDAGGFDDLW